MDTSSKGPKTIATIDVNVHWPKIEKRAWIDESVNDHLKCILCGDSLKFDHKTDFISGVVTEDAHCPSCKVRNRQSSHKLQ